MTNNVRNQNPQIQNLYYNQLINMLRQMGYNNMTENEVRPRQRPTEQATFQHLIQNIRFQLNSINFGNADVLLLEQKSHKIIEAIEVLVKALIDS